MQRRPRTFGIAIEEHISSMVLKTSTCTNDLLQGTSVSVSACWLCEDEVQTEEPVMQNKLRNDQQGKGDDNYDDSNNKYTRYSMVSSRRRATVRIFWVKRIRRMVVALLAQRPTVYALTTRWPSARAAPVTAPVSAILALHTLLLPWHHSNF